MNRAEHELLKAEHDRLKAQIDRLAYLRAKYGHEDSPGWLTSGTVNKRHGIQSDPVGADTTGGDAVGSVPPSATQLGTPGERVTPQASPGRSTIEDQAIDLT